MTANVTRGLSITSLTQKGPSDPLGRFRSWRMEPSPVLFKSVPMT